MSEKLERQNEAIIGLLARSTLGVPAISKIVRSGKRNPQAYLKVYNSLDGATGVTELAKIAKVSQPTMSVVLQSWEEQGIIYNSGRAGGPGPTPNLSNFGRSNAKLSPPTTQNYTEGAPGSFFEPGSWVSSCYPFHQTPKFPARWVA